MTARITCARGGASTARAASNARANAKLSATVESPETRATTRAALSESTICEEPVDALVDVSEALLEPRYGLAVGGEAEMARLNNAGVHRTDGYLMQSLAVHGLKCIVGRIPKQRWFPRTERRAQPPRAVIEPRSFIGRTSRGVAIEIHDCAFEPDRGRMIFAD